jgi:MFS family permease
MQMSSAASDGHGQSVPRASWIALGLLLAAYTFSWVDRYIFAILIEPIRTELGLADWQIGLLTGFAFTLAYAIAGFPFARWSDRGSRSAIISVALGSWSLITVLCGFASNFVGLALARSGVAVCEAGCSPAAHSLISDLFPRHRRALAFAIYGLGISLGIWLGLALGGLISRAYGWRIAFIALGAPGLLLAVIVRVALREPPRGRYDAADHDRHYPWRQALALLWQRRAFVAIALGLSFLSFNGSGVQLWAPSYMLRAGDGDIATIGMFTGTANGIAGIIGTLLAGFVADRFAARDPRWYPWIAICSVLVIVPGQLLFLFTSGWLSYLCYTLTMFALSTYTAPLFSAGQMLLPPRLRAFGAATMLFLLNMIGPGAGPAAIGVLSDWLPAADAQDGLRNAMAFSAVSLVPAVVCLLYAARRLKIDMAP